VVLKREIYQYTFCPEKHRLQYAEGIAVPPTNKMILGVLLHATREILEREEHAILKRVEKDFSFDTILEEYKGKKEAIFKSAMKKKASLVHRLSEEELDFAEEDLDLLLHEKAVKAKRVVQTHLLDREPLAEYLSPPWKYVKYEMSAKKVRLQGTADLIEHFGSFFYPVEIKTGHAPEENMFKPDRMEIGCVALLMEDHFKVPVPVGFVEYTRIGERRPVRIDEKLKRTVLHVRDLILEKDYPEKEYTGKCTACEYRGVCWDDSNN
jgi:CRISPR-associated exonuclease Cas4